MVGDAHAIARRSDGDAAGEGRLPDAEAFAVAEADGAHVGPSARRGVSFEHVEAVVCPAAHVEALIAGEREPDERVGHPDDLHLFGAPAGHVVEEDVLVPRPGDDAALVVDEARCTRT